jgi:ribosomal protein L6P/L9E
MFIKSNLVLLLIHNTAWQISILIKKFLLELLIKTYKQIKLVGTGFKVNTINNFLINVLVFKLGFSHFIYLKTSCNITHFSHLSLKVFLISDSITNLINLSFLIKSLKLTDVYNGKGIFYYNEQFKLKPLKSN